MSRVSINGWGDQDSLPGHIIPKTQKMVLDAVLLSTQHYKCSSYWKGAFESPVLFDTYNFVDEIDNVRVFKRYTVFI